MKIHSVNYYTPRAQNRATINRKEELTPSNYHTKDFNQMAIKKDSSLIDFSKKNPYYSKVKQFPNEEKDNNNKDNKNCLKNDENATSLPKGNSSYAKAKRAECEEKNPEKAEFFYKKAIKENIKADSAIKDLASLWNQKGRPEEALDLLISHKHFFADKIKYKNLKASIKARLIPNKTQQIKHLKISGLSPEVTQEKVLSLFTNPTRILNISFGSDLSEATTNYFSVLKFQSHSAARKTLEEFKLWKEYRIEWISDDGKIVSDAHYAKQKINSHRQKFPSFSHVIFERETKDYLYSLALDDFQGIVCNAEFKEIETRADKFLGKALYEEIFT